MMSIYHALGSLFGWLMRLIYMGVQNYGVAIILFTLVTKIILFPISYKQMKNSARMKLIAPKLEKLKKSYSNNPQKLQEEQMKLYGELGVNPMASCLPMLVQFIILFGVLDVVYRPLTHILKMSSKVILAAKSALLDANMPGLRKADGLRDELYILRANQSSDYSDVLSKIDGFKSDVLNDFYDKFQIFGVHLGQQPTLKIWTLDHIGYEQIALFLIPFIAGALQLILTIYGQRKNISENPGANQMKGLNFMMYIMPIFSIWFAFVVPAGVGFYWICSSFFSLIQTIALNNYFTNERIAKINEKDMAKAKKKKATGKLSFYERAVQAQSAQNMNLNAHKEEIDSEIAGMSRKKAAEYNRNKVNEARKKLYEKYGENISEDEKKTDIYEAELTDSERDTLESARKKMAEKYGEY